jgi:hypothetical protein
MREYYALYPQDLSQSDDGVTAILLLQNIHERTESMIGLCAGENFIRAEDVKELAAMTVFLYKGLLEQALEAGEGGYDKAELVSRAMRYVRICYEGFLQDAQAPREEPRFKRSALQIEQAHSSKPI